MNYIDLGLPSGTLWATENENGYFTYNEAVMKFKENMPTKEQWKELFDNTTSDWITVDGVNGRKFTADNGNSIFLPADGYFDDSERDVYYAGSNGYYWALTFDESLSNSAWGMDFDFGYQLVSSYGCEFGESVRLVKTNK